MKILIITDRNVRRDKDIIYGPASFTSIIRRLSVLGELHLCVVESINDNNRIQVFNESLNDYVDIEHVFFIKKSFIWPSKSVARTIKEQISKVDLVIGYVPSLNAEVANLYAKKSGKKYFALMVACPWDGLWNQDWKRKIAAPYRFFMNRYVLRHSDYALYVTHNFLQKRYPTKGMSIGLSDVVLKKTDTRTLESRIEHISNMNDGDKIKLATTAMLNVKYKGQRFVIRAIKKLKDMGYTDYEYYLIGGGDNKVLSSLAKKLGVENQIHFVGKVTHEEVFAVLDDIDIYVHPSLQEGLPRSVVEAMSRALPCIGSNTAAIPELIDNKFIVKRKSVDEIVNRILKFRDKKILLEQAKLNFEEAKKYECQILDERRNEFYRSIKRAIES